VKYCVVERGGELWDGVRMDGLGRRGVSGGWGLILLEWGWLVDVSECILEEREDTNGKSRVIAQGKRSLGQEVTITYASTSGVGASLTSEQRYEESVTQPEAHPPLYIQTTNSSIQIKQTKAMV
jgi:hypothetical protein